MTKRRNNIHKMNAEEKAALGRFQKDLKSIMPHAFALAEAAKGIHQAMIDAPQWTITEAPRPDDMKPEMWSVGHAKVNYVDHIKTEGTQDK